MLYVCISILINQSVTSLSRQDRLSSLEGWCYLVLFLYFIWMNRRGDIDVCHHLCEAEVEYDLSLSQWPLVHLYICIMLSLDYLGKSKS